MKKAVVAFGNPLMGDDGAGIYLLKKLKEHLKGKSWEVIEGGNIPLPDTFPQLR